MRRSHSIRDNRTSSYSLPPASTYHAKGAYIHPDRAHLLHGHRDNHDGHQSNHNHQSKRLCVDNDARRRDRALQEHPPRFVTRVGDAWHIQWHPSENLSDPLALTSARCFWLHLHHARLTATATTAATAPTGAPLRQLRQDIDREQRDLAQWSSSVFRIARTLSNPFETDDTLKFQNRSAVKLLELRALLQRAGAWPWRQPPETTRVSFVDLCSAPGGFSEAMFACYKWRAVGYAMSLRDLPEERSERSERSNRTSSRPAIEFRVDKFHWTAPSETFHTFFGPGGDGSIVNPKDRRGDVTRQLIRNSFVEFVRSKEPGEPGELGAESASSASSSGPGVDIVLADGGFDVQGHESHQEELSLPLLAGQLLTGYNSLRHGTNTVLVCKFIGGLHPMTHWLISKLQVGFRTFALIKPTQSRPANFERYIAFVGKLPVKETTQGITNSIHAIDTYLQLVESAQDALQFSREGLPKAMQEEFDSRRGFSRHQHQRQNEADQRRKERTADRICEEQRFTTSHKFMHVQSPALVMQSDRAFETKQDQQIRRRQQQQQQQRQGGGDYPLGRPEDSRPPVLSHDDMLTILRKVEQKMMSAPDIPDVGDSGHEKQLLQQAARASVADCIDKAVMQFGRQQLHALQVLNEMARCIDADRHATTSRSTSINCNDRDSAVFVCQEAEHCGGRSILVDAKSVFPAMSASWISAINEPPANESKDSDMSAAAHITEPSHQELAHEPDQEFEYDPEHEHPISIAPMTTTATTRTESKHDSSSGSSISCSSSSEWQWTDLLDDIEAYPQLTRDVVRCLLERGGDGSVPNATPLVWPPTTGTIREHMTTEKVLRALYDCTSKDDTNTSLLVATPMDGSTWHIEGNKAENVTHGIKLPAFCMLRVRSQHSGVFRVIDRDPAALLLVRHMNHDRLVLGTD